MSRRPRLLSAFTAVALATGLTLATAAPASADPAVCAAIVGTWDAPTTTCTVSPSTQTLGADQTIVGNVVIGIGGVILNGPNSLIVTGDLLLQGPMTVNDLTVVVGGTTTVVAGGGLTVSSVGTFDGDVTLSGGGFDSTGTVTGTLTSGAGAVTNGGQLGAALITGGTFTNAATATTSTVTVSTNGSLVNDGAISPSGVTFSGTGTFTGSGTTAPGYPQTVAFSSVAPAAPAVGDTYPTTLTTSSVGTSATVAAEPAGVCSISGATVTFDGVGTCTITASRPASGNFAAATATQTVVLAAAADGGATLPATGVEAGTWMLLALGALVLGGGILLMRRTHAVRS